MFDKLKEDQRNHAIIATAIVISCVMMWSGWMIAKAHGNYSQMREDVAFCKAVSQAVVAQSQRAQDQQGMQQRVVRVTPEQLERMRQAQQNGPQPVPAQSVGPPEDGGNGISEAD